MIQIPQVAASEKGTAQTYILSSLQALGVGVEGRVRSFCRETKELQTDLLVEKPGKVYHRG